MGPCKAQEDLMEGTGPPFFPCKRRVSLLGDGVGDGDIAVGEALHATMVTCAASSAAGCETTTHQASGSGSDPKTSIANLDVGDMIGPCWEPHGMRLTFGRLRECGVRLVPLLNAEDDKVTIRCDRLGSPAGNPFTRGASERCNAAYNDLLRIAAFGALGLFAEQRRDGAGGLIAAIAARHRVSVAREHNFTGLEALHAWLLSHARRLAAGLHIKLLCDCELCLRHSTTTEACPLWSLAGAILWMARHAVGQQERLSITEAV